MRQNNTIKVFETVNPIRVGPEPPDSIARKHKSSGSWSHDAVTSLLQVREESSAHIVKVLRCLVPESSGQSVSSCDLNLF